MRNERYKVDISGATYEVTVNHDLDKYDNVVLFPKKLARANEMIAKWGLPKEWEDEIGESERENDLFVKGKLCQGNIDTHSFLIIVEATDSQPQMSYMVTTTSDILTKLFNEYWERNAVNVHIKPKIESPDQYELVDIVTN